MVNLMASAGKLINTAASTKDNLKTVKGMDKVSLSDPMDLSKLEYGKTESSENEFNIVTIKMYNASSRL